MQKSIHEKKIKMRVTWINLHSKVSMQTFSFSRDGLLNHWLNQSSQYIFSVLNPIKYPDNYYSKRASFPKYNYSCEARKEKWRALLLLGRQITGHPIEPRAHFPGVRLLSLLSLLSWELVSPGIALHTMSPSRIHPRKSRLNYRAERKGGISSGASVRAIR